MAELSTLRANTGLSPFPLWRTNAGGQVIWVNQAYLDAGCARHGVEAMRSWPIPHLFDELSRPGGLAPGKTSRFSLNRQDADVDSWYECSVIEVDGDLLYTAMNIDEIVSAEVRLREVTQTLTKTFANLTIGLAVFGRRRNLTLFNPALTELTGLPFEFLASRPSLPVFLDQLREERMMPEPKDYKSWRDHLAQLEAESVDGTFEETWTMPGAQTWRVTGRPHPDGAIAILFEDISLEMSLTRRFHQDLDQSQEVLDSLDDAIAVFGLDGMLAQSNLAYRRLWHDGQPDGLEECSLRDATQQWHKLTSPTPVWGDFRDFASETRNRLEWSAEVRLLDGRRMTCRFTPISNGATLVRFALDPIAFQAPPQEMRRAI
jgi:PAS domain-containing protein